MSDYIDYVDNDAEYIHDTILSDLMEACDEPLYPGDERRIFGEALVSVIVALNSEHRDKAKQRLLRYARGEVLDGLGELVGVVRANPYYAHATFRFSTSVAQPEPITIPINTRITTTDGDVYFATDVIAVIKTGETHVDVEAHCEQGGEKYNGFTAGSIATMVDMIPFVDKVENITNTIGGNDGEPYTEEGDARMRERIRLAPASLTSAGAEESYRYHAVSAHPDIMDVMIDSPSACEIVIYPLLKGGKLPDESVLQAVNDACNARNVRPLGDRVQVLAPVAVEYSINIHYYCAAEAEADVVSAIEGEGGAIDKYNELQQSHLGGAINPDALRKLLFVPGDGTAGADRVTVTAPTYQELQPNEVAQLKGPIVVTHEVI